MKRLIKKIADLCYWLYFKTMAYPYTPKIQSPFKDYAVNSCKFQQKCTHSGVDWGIHLGEDYNRKAGTVVKAIGRGKVVYSGYHAGSIKKPNWGKIVIIAHKNPETKQVFFSLYGHLGNVCINKGDSVQIGQSIGTIGKANTPENGWWEDAHLHFAIYTGPWSGRVLPGYFRKDQKITKLKWWQEPRNFIENYPNP